jgi:hypothetical protein
MAGEFDRSMRLLASASIFLAVQVPSFACNVCTGTKQDRATLDLRTICAGIELYQLKLQRPPQRISDLQDAYVLREIPLDPWGDEYRYSVTDAGTTVWSFGRDGIAGGTGPDADQVLKCDRTNAPAE